MDKKSDGVATTWRGGEKKSGKTAKAMERRLPEGLAENGPGSEAVGPEYEGRPLFNLDAEGYSKTVSK